MVTVTSSSDDDARPRVLVVEDAVLMRMELADMLEAGGFRALPVASAEEALKVLTAASDIQAIVTDVNLSPEGEDGFVLARQVYTERNIGVVVISGQVAPDRELPPGIHFLAKPVHEATLLHLVRSIMPAHAQETPASPAAVIPRGETIRAVGEGTLTLTPRQQEVLELLIQGKSNREIAEASGLSENTVRVHLTAIFRVLNVSSRVEAVLAGLQHLRGPSNVGQRLQG